MSDMTEPKSGRSGVFVVRDRCTALLDRLADRLPADQLAIMRRANFAGEWLEVVSNLTAVLIGGEIPVTSAERDGTGQRRRLSRATDLSWKSPHCVGGLCGSVQWARCRAKPERGMIMPRVFVSYAHDNQDHKIQVLRLCEVLRGQGVDARLDTYDDNERRDWYAWYVDQVNRADFVLVIASRDYRIAGDGQAAATCNRGVQSEAALLRDLLHADRPTWTKRILPVILPGRSVAEIPLFLQPNLASRYVVAEVSASGIEQLLRTITDQPAHPLPALGNPPTLPPLHIPDETHSTSTMNAQVVGSGNVYQAGRDQYIGDR